MDLNVTCEGKYVTAEEVLRYLKIDYTDDDISLLDDLIIPMVCDEIDSLAGTSWRKCTVTNEYHRMGYPRAYGFWLWARPIYLNYYPVTEVTKLEIWMGGNEYMDWTNAETGRLGRWWIDNKNGIIWINWMFWYAGMYDARVSYTFGVYEEDESGNVIPKPNGYVKRLALLWSAYRFLDSERYSSRVADGISDANTYQQQMTRLKKEIEYLKDRIAGVKIVTGGQV